MEIAEKIKNLQTQHKKHLVFYFDTDGTFRDELPGIADAGIRIVEVQDNYFELKYRLEFDWATEPVLLYHRFPKPDANALRNYPLLDLLVANPELRLDDVSELMEAYQLPDMYYTLVKRYIKQLKTKTNQKKLARILDPAQFSETSLKQGLIGLTLDVANVSDKTACMAKWLYIGATDGRELRRINETLADLDVAETMVHWLNMLLDVQGKDLSEDLAQAVARKLKYNVLTAFVEQPVPQDTYVHLKLKRTVEVNKVLAFFQDWTQHPALREYIEPVFNQLADDIQLSSVLNWYGLEREYGYYSNDLLHVILKGLYTSLTENPVKTRDDCTRWNRSSVLSDDQKLQVVFLFHTADMYVLLGTYRTFVFDTPEDYIQNYTTELYKVDLNFRKAVIAYNQVRDRLYEFEELAVTVFNDLNERYDRFLIALNVEWQKLMETTQFNFHDLKVEKQFDFYKNNLKDVDYKIAVIVSDALRYELGVELYNDLLANSKNNLTLAPCLASIPSYTNLGMANLLPGAGMTVEKGEADLVFRIQDKTTASTNRAQILQHVEKESATVDFSQVVKWDRETGRTFFNSNRLVYIYHDWIDAIGDKKRTEHETFEATTKATEDIKVLISKLYGWNVYHILVTSDHGFLFNYKTLTETSRENLPKTEGYCRDHVRFVVADKFPEKVDGYQMPLRNTTNLDTDLNVAVPRAINRFRKQGNVGVQFVHGGASLQELIVPVIKFYKHKKEISQAVTFRRIDRTAKITTGSLKVSLLQDQPVSNDYKSIKIKLGLYSDTGELLSNENELTIDSVSQNPKERVFETILTLNSKGSRASFCYLKAFDKKDKERLNPLHIRDLITISSLMEKDDF
jgi:uncharacterized protein (TIGR02687 family)